MADDVAIDPGMYMCHECDAFATVLRPEDVMKSRVWTPFCKKHADKNKAELDKSETKG